MHSEKESISKAPKILEEVASFRRKGAFWRPGRETTTGRAL